MALALLENPKDQIPFALCGSSESDRTDPVVINTYSVCDFGVTLFPVDLNAYSHGMACVATAVAFDPLQGVREVVSAIRETRPLPTAQSLDALLRRAAESHGTPSDIEAWARRLADDSSNLDD